MADALLVVKNNNMAIVKPRRGPTPQYDFEKEEITIPVHKLPSFRNLLSRYNKAKTPKIVFKYTYNQSNTKVTATKSHA